jgi:hypothetical protein
VSVHRREAINPTGDGRRPVAHILR